MRAYWNYTLHEWATEGKTKAKDIRIGNDVLILLAQWLHTVWNQIKLDIISPPIKVLNWWYKLERTFKIKVCDFCSLVAKL